MEITQERNNRACQLRKHPRMLPAEEIYAVFGTDKDVIGKLCDISMGGLSCKHLTTSENGFDCDSLDLFSLNDAFHMTRVPCSVVYSLPMQGSDLEMENSMTVKTRRIGVKFNGLSYLHESQLKSLMENSTRWN